MRSSRTTACALVMCLALVLPGISLRAQVLGLPLINSGAPTGISIGADLGLPNAAAGDYTAIGANVAVGIGLVGVRGTISRVSSKGGDAIWAKGATATIRLFGGPLIPFRAMLLGGWADWKEGSATVTRMPISFGLAATIPNPAFAIKPWIAPRAELERTSIGGSSHDDTHFGISAGVDVSLLNGLSLRAAYDRQYLKATKPSILSFGLGFSL